MLGNSSWHITHTQQTMTIVRTLFPFPLFLLFIIFYWRKIVLQNFVVFCQTSIWISHAAAAAAKSLQLHLTLYDPIDGSPPGSAVPGLLQARALEWVAISFSNAWEWKVKVKSLSRVRLWVTLWSIAHQAPPSMGFSRQEYWSGVSLPSPWISHRYTYIPSLLNFPPISLPIPLP